MVDKRCVRKEFKKNISNDIEAAKPVLIIIGIISGGLVCFFGWMFLALFIGIWICGTTGGTSTLVGVVLCFGGWGIMFVICWLISAYMEAKQTCVDAEKRKANSG